MITSSLAFKYVAVAVMMAEVNYFGQQLHLNGRFPTDIYGTTMRNAADFGSLGYGGRIDTPGYSFGFGDRGERRFITKLEDNRYQSMGLYRGNESMKEFMNRFSRIKSAINTNDAYRLATNWLVAIGMDLPALEKAQPVTIQQQFYQSDQGDEVPCPLFYVEWGKWKVDELGHPQDGPAVKVMISGINGDLLSFRIENGAYSKRPLVLIRDIDKLRAIPDSEFLKYSSAERSNLVVRFSAISYSQTNTLAQSHAPPIKR